MDEKFIEQAGELAERVNSAGAAACSRQALPDTDLEPDQYLSELCEECEDPLPEFRKKKGQVLCVSCKSVKEKPQRR